MLKLNWLKEPKSGSLRTDIENSIIIMLICTLAGLLFYMLNLSEANIITIYILGILVVSSITSAPLFGIVSSVLGVVLFNCLFAEPRFTFNFFDPQYGITAAIMLAASLVTSSVMTMFRQQMRQQIFETQEKERLRATSERIAREAEEERLRANLLRTISHDLRTPLAGIAGSADVLLSNDQQLNPESRRQLYQSVYDEAQWLSGLVENLLSITRLENGPLALDLQPELLHEIIPEALSHLSKRGKDHRIELKLPEELLMVRADARLIMQVVINMTDNAIKYSPPGSLIVVTARAEQGLAIVEVTDQGFGIPDEHKTKVFEMYHTAGNSHGEGKHGIGLGLPLCKSIIQAHGGEIYLSDNPPCGTIIGFKLPLEGIY